jgi:hypothetical protein
VINNLVAVARRAKSAIVIFSATGVIFSVNWYDLMSVPLGGVA